MRDLSLIQSIRDIALALNDPDTGEVVRKKGDYSTRQGVFSLHITSLELTNNSVIKSGGHQQIQ